MRHSEVVRQVQELGIRPGGVLLVHTSFRAVRPVEGGPAGLIAALLEALGPDGTLAMPSWTYDDDRLFDPAFTPAAVELGVVADTFWRLPGVSRSEHPFALAAVGLRAAEIVAGPLPIPPAALTGPVGHVHGLGGQILLLGVGHDSNTTLHLAELLAEVPYGVPRHTTVMGTGGPERIDYLENDHCCERFALADGWLRGPGLQREGPVGSAHARLMDARDLVRVACEKLAADPLLFLHPPGAACQECDAARASVSR